MNKINVCFDSQYIIKNYVEISAILGKCSCIKFHNKKLIYIHIDLELDQL